MNNFWKLICQGFSTFTLFPDAKYFLKKSNQDYIREAWERTGDDLREAMGLAPQFKHERSCYYEDDNE